MQPKIVNKAGRHEINLYGVLGQNPKPEKVTASAVRSYLQMINAYSATGEILLYGEVDSLFGIDPKQFASDLDALGDVDEVTINVNSPGGNVFDGLSIFSILRRHPAKKNVQIDGVAASIAALISQAGDNVSIAEPAQFMIHNAAAVSFGEAQDMRETADLLDQVTDSIANVFAKRSGQAIATVRTWMNAETWFTSTEAVANGFADVVIPIEKREALSARAVAARLREIDAETEAAKRWAQTPAAVQARLSEIAADVASCAAQKAQHDVPTRLLQLEHDRLDDMVAESRERADLRNHCRGQRRQHAMGH